MALEPDPAAMVAGRSEWVCPMHPEVVRDAPGTCPICGMALERRAGAVQEDDGELRDMQRRFVVSLLLAIVTLFVAVDGRFAGMLGVADPIKESTPEAMRSAEV
jgi:Cu+-exporting ATPase